MENAGGSGWFGVRIVDIKFALQQGQVRPQQNIDNYIVSSSVSSSARSNCCGSSGIGSSLLKILNKKIQKQGGKEHI
jgi:hypothetical protein